ncbi:secretion protein snm4 [Mycolicibacterium aurum]|uniref:Secretion protein snm4 n=1 Tax=Mycolicibacterium aurum TaxID=1791 RepID=A0A448IIG9_MYCAU|nr:secretion protein snm4 [Mycolicibacterium aurum]
MELVLPARHPLGELLPAIVDAVIGGPGRPRHWYLTRVAGATLDTSISLRDNAVDDGDTLVLATTRIARPRRLPTEACGVVAATAPARPTAPRRGTVLAGGLVAAALGAAALLRYGLASPGEWPLWSAAGLSAAAAAGSVAVGRSDRHLAALLHGWSVVFAAATGVLAIPGAGWQSVFLLSAAAAFAMSAVLLRVTPGDAVLIACSAATGAMAASAAVCATVAPQPGVAGATLAVLSLGALSWAPKLTVAAAGLGPSRHDAGARRAAAAHRTLTGLVAGWSATAALGVAVSAAVSIHTGTSSTLAAAFATDLAVVLLLRQRCHVDGYRRACLATAGVAALVMAALVTVAAAPAQGFWISVAAAVACGAGLRRGADTSAVPNPLTRRIIQVTEYLALAAVIPLAFWVTGLYGVVREWSL